MNNRRQSEVIKAIAERAVALSAKHGLGKWKVSDAVMDITCAHEDCGLRLDDLLAADDFNFAHDVFGINRHLDHSTLKLTDCFRPRFAS
jgi:hypothetical protein